MLELVLVDAAMLALALVALSCTLREYRRVVSHRHLLLPGLFSVAASMAMVAYPWIGSLWESERMMIAALSLMVGVVRGRFMKLASDRTNHVAELTNAADGVAVAALQAIVALLDMVLDIRAGGLTRFTQTIELVQIVAAAYLLGRSVTLWMHVRTSAHVDLVNR